MPRRKLPPVHPGEILHEEFLVPLGLSQYRLAKETSVPPRRINEIVRGERAVTADTALRLARYFGTSERFWLNLQARYDLEVEKDRLGNRLQREVKVRAVADMPAAASDRADRRTKPRQRTAVRPGGSSEVKVP
jgi:addiction module HigA family antidote